MIVAEFMVIDNLKYLHGLGTGYCLAQLVVIDKDQRKRERRQKGRLGRHSGQRPILLERQDSRFTGTKQLLAQMGKWFTNADGSEFAFREQRNRRGQSSQPGCCSGVVRGQQNTDPLFLGQRKEIIAKRVIPGNHQHPDPTLDGRQQDGTAVTRHDQQLSRIITGNPVGEGFLQHGADKEIKGGWRIVITTSHEPPGKASGQGGRRGDDFTLLITAGKQILFGQPQQ